VSRLDKEFMDGYFDGLDLTSPEPNNNRHVAYKHSFYVGRAEIAGKHLPASVSRARAKMIEDSIE